MTSELLLVAFVFFFVFFIFFFYLFFFQAEDGIRDLVRSRGLGDVYKRQSFFRAEIRRSASRSLPAASFRSLAAAASCGVGATASDRVTTVSYTHLTLPTSDLV